MIEIPHRARHAIAARVSLFHLLGEEGQGVGRVTWGYCLYHTASSAWNSAHIYCCTTVSYRSRVQPSDLTTHLNTNRSRNLRPTSILCFRTPTSPWVQGLYHTTTVVHIHCTSISSPRQHAFFGFFYRHLFLIAYCYCMDFVGHTVLHSLQQYMYVRRVQDNRTLVLHAYSSRICDFSGVLDMFS